MASDRQAPRDDQGGINFIKYKFMLMPWLLIISGTIFLLENLNLIPAIRWSIVWPVVLILAGLYLMKKRSGDCSSWRREKKDNKTQ